MNKKNFLRFIFIVYNAQSAAVQKAPKAAMFLLTATDVGVLHTFRNFTNQLISVTA